MKPSTGMWETFSALKADVHALHEMLHEMLQDGRHGHVSSADYAMWERQIRARLDGFRVELECADRRRR